MLFYFWQLFYVWRAWRESKVHMLERWMIRDYDWLIDWVSEWVMELMSANMTAVVESFDVWFSTKWWFCHCIRSVASDDHGRRLEVAHTPGGHGSITDAVFAVKGLSFTLIANGRGATLSTNVVQVSRHARLEEVGQISAAWSWTSGGAGGVGRPGVMGIGGLGACIVFL